MRADEGEPQEQTALTAFQIEVARTFFSLPAADRFLVAGGAALLAQHMTARPTQDLDFFTGVPGLVVTASEQFEEVATSRGWSVDVVQESDTFCRLVVHGPEDLLVDIALDSPAIEPATASIIGPTYAPVELATRKLLALFDRAAARDFVDVLALTRSYSRDELIERAQHLDPGFDAGFLAQQLETLRRFRDEDLPIDLNEVHELRRYFELWTAEIRGGWSQQGEST